MHHQPHRAERIHFGATVYLADEAGQTLCYRIVGADEIDPERGYISVDSPMARALLGRERGDRVRVDRPDGVSEFEVQKVSYEGT